MTYNAVYNTNTNSQNEDSHPSIISSGIVNKLIYISATLLVIAACIFGFAKLYGEDISHGDFSLSTKRLEISIGSDHLRIPENTIRFPHQRHSGLTERLELYSHWTSLSGYSEALKHEFKRGVENANLVFLTLEERSMSFDMSGRVEPIYKRFFDGEPTSQSYGLVRQPLSAEDGYIDEDLYYAASSPYPFATRCVREDSEIATPFCIRDIHIGRNLMLTYRFHKKFLPQFI